MMGFFLKWLTGGGVAALDALAARFAPNKDLLEANLHAEAAQQLGAYAAEYTAPRDRRTPWDSAVDGLNRLPRPFMAFAVMGLMAWAPIDPAGFALAMQAYALVPEWLAATLFGVAAFYFTSRHFERRLELKGPDPATVQAVMAARPRPPPSDPAPMADDTYHARMADPAPLDDATLAEWARRQKGK
ncbi:3TM-type holin [Pararhodospirillum photometricum]|uniref:3TM-type holin n=1 Tax=Pararhodospirillum photometricum TaxID=1084 RepID=UPI0002DF437B|nr:3TM-type holin [Pararhodospirillum photometricum]